MSNDVRLYYRLLIILSIVCPMVQNSPKLKLAFWYPVSQFSRDFQTIL